MEKMLPTFTAQRELFDAICSRGAAWHHRSPIDHSRFDGLAHRYLSLVAKLPYELFHTLREFYLALPDGVSMYPAHGHGSPCGADIGDRMESTIGYEREFNPFLRFSDFEKFKQHVLSNAPPVPKYFKHAVEEKAGVL
jgi:hypothetical protein